VRLLWLLQDFVNVAMQQWNFTLGNDVMVRCQWHHALLVACGGPCCSISRHLHPPPAAYGLALMFLQWTQGTDFSYENAAYWYENMVRRCCCCCCCRCWS